MPNKRGFTRFILPIPQPRYLNVPGPRRAPPPPRGVDPVTQISLNHQWLDALADVDAQGYSIDKDELRRELGNLDEVRWYHEEGIRDRTGKLVEAPFYGSGRYGLAAMPSFQKQRFTVNVEEL